MEQEYVSQQADLWLWDIDDARLHLLRTSGPRAFVTGDLNDFFFGIAAALDKRSFGSMRLDDLRTAMIREASIVVRELAQAGVVVGFAKEKFQVLPQDAGKLSDMLAWFSGLYHNLALEEREERVKMGAYYVQRARSQGKRVGRPSKPSS